MQMSDRWSVALIAANENSIDERLTNRIDLKRNGTREKWILIPRHANGPIKNSVKRIAATRRNKKFTSRAGARENLFRPHERGWGWFGNSVKLGNNTVGDPLSRSRGIAPSPVEDFIH